MTSATDNRTTELLPCPFCGGEADISDEGPGTEPERYWVFCANGRCFVEGTPAFTTEAEAIAVWNTRAELGSGTCENLEKRNASLWFVCSRCGAQAGNGTYSEEWMHQDHTHEEYAEYDGEPFNFCPNCGARVEGGTE